jgi:hypothetical protein
MRNLMDALVVGVASLEDVDDWVDEWHNGSAPAGTELREYLGMTWDEYELWIHRRGILEEFVEMRLEPYPHRDLMMSALLGDPGIYRIDPWGVEIPFRNGNEFRIRGFSSQPGRFEIEDNGKLIILTAWPGAVVIAAKREIPFAPWEILELPQLRKPWKENG